MNKKPWWENYAEHNEFDLVQRAARKLDEIEPNWFHKINLKILDMIDPQKCIIGQVFPEGYYGLALEQYFQSLRYAFVADKYLWIKVIYARRRPWLKKLYLRI